MQCIQFVNLYCQGLEHRVQLAGDLLDRQVEGLGCHGRLQVLDVRAEEALDEGRYLGLLIPHRILQPGKVLGVVGPAPCRVALDRAPQGGRSGHDW